ncbi:cytokine receptor family member B16 [Cololabis saira]|uniref:cytokine receptor family member B16 n=1 Tax=Cololabis saira TaxID=129043 RepID=UPI002AD44605|nr:cytokine receptor family member B16 [Cololabis saira]
METLEAPGQVAMESVNMKHTLRWLPLQAACRTTVLYSVQYQGEFELLVKNGSWMDAAECQQIPVTRCDLTFDLGSDSSYNLRVRAGCGSELSAWTRLSRPFNRQDTVLTGPRMTVSTAGDSLQVAFEDLPLTAAASVTVWRKDHEQQAVSYLMPAEQGVLHVAALQDGAVYCITAQTVLHSGTRGSSSRPQCVSITGGAAAAWKKPTTVTVTLVLVSGLLVAVFWTVVHCGPNSGHAHFHKEPLPQSLKCGGNVQILMFPRGDEEEERCEQLLSVEPATEALKV